VSENNPFQPKNDIIQFCSLGSGSKGNGTLISFANTIILIDCGFSTKETCKRLSLRGLHPEQISAILVTHEHADHIAGVSGLSNKYSVPVWINKGTSLHAKCASIKTRQIFNSHHSFQLGDFEILPVTVPHDSREATQFVLTAGEQSIGLLTDVGHITQHIIDSYSVCDALLLEFNYEHDYLMQGSYPLSLKRRVSGDFGHLSNQQAIEMLIQIASPKLQMLVAMHMSEENNSAELIKSKIEELTELSHVTHFVAEQSKGFEWFSL